MVPAAQQITARFGVSPASDVIVRVAGGPLLSCPLASLAQSLAPADLARCLAQGPRQAMHLLFARLDLDREAVGAIVDHHGAAQFAGIVDDAGPDEFQDRIATHPPLHS